MRYVMMVSFDHAGQLDIADIADVLCAVEIKELYPYSVWIHQLRRYDSQNMRVNNDGIRFVHEPEDVPEP